MADIFDEISDKDIAAALTEQNLEQVSPIKAFKEALLSGSTSESLPARAVRATGRFVIPESAPELAAMIVAGALSGGLAAPLGAPALRFAARALGPGLAASGTAALTGGDPTTEGLKALAGAAVPEAAGLGLRAIGRPLGSAVFRAKLRVQGVDDAKRFLDAARKEAPLLPNLKSSDDLIKLVDPEIGEKALRHAFDKADTAAIDLMNNLPTPVLQKAFPKLSPILKRSIPSKEGGYTPKEIPGLVKMLKAASREADEGALGFRFREEVRQFEEAYKNLLRRDPNVLEAYEKAVQNFARGEKVINLLRKSGAIASDEKGAFLDSQRLAKYMIENVDDYSPVEFPTLWTMVSRGGPIGARDVIEPFLRSERIGLPSPGPLPYVSVGFPTLARRRLAGQQTPSVFQGGRAQGIADLLGLRAASTLADPGSQ